MNNLGELTNREYLSGRNRNSGARGNESFSDMRVAVKCAAGYIYIYIRIVYTDDYVNRARYDASLVTYELFITNAYYSAETKKI